MSPFDHPMFKSRPAELPELSPQLLSAAKAIIAQGPPSLMAFMAHVIEQTQGQPKWDDYLAQSVVGLMDELAGESHYENDLDDGRIYRVKITLRGCRPAVFREVEVPNVTLGELHEVIQVAMGWTNSHLHAFRFGRVSYGPMDNEFQLDDSRDEESLSLRDLVDEDRRKFIYEYDFGDGWEHDILISAATKYPKPGQTYPHCLKGEFACPPEDCGGIYGYMQICELLNTPKAQWSDDDKERMSWVGKFDPAAFSVDAVNKSFRKYFAPADEEPAAAKPKRSGKKSK